MIVGQVGSGKSTLGNKILDHPDYTIFDEGLGSSTRMTTETHKVSWGNMVVIDTPGVSGSDSFQNLDCFDSIVERIRCVTQ